MPPVGFEPTISAGERPQTYVLDRAAIGTGTQLVLFSKIRGVCCWSQRNKQILRELRSSGLLRTE